MAENKTVARAEREANRFADVARANSDNTSVEVETEDSRLTPSSNLQRTIRVTVQDVLGQTTMASWTADIEKPSFGKRSVRFFGWGASVLTRKSGRISLGMCYIRVRSY